MAAQQIEPLAGERAERESDAAVVACNDYLRMGIGRSLRDLVRTYNEARTEAPPSKHFATIARWSTDYGWQERASAYDAAIERQKTAEIARLRNEGLAADYERLRRLTRLADDLEQQIYYCAVMRDGDELADAVPTTGLQVKQRPHLWVRDVKQIGGGEYAREVEVFRYNSALIADYRGVLDDIAKEVGGRKQRLEHTGPNDGPLQIQAVEDAMLKTYGDNDSDATAAGS